MKKILSVLLSLCILVSLCAMPVSATGFEGNEIDFGKMTGTSEFLDTESLEDGDFFINEEVAYYVAKFFIRDMAECDYASWDADTEIVRMIPMYDETGESITAYTAELFSGYIVVSAYVDVPSIILEWADETPPIYSEFERSSDNKIIYVGGLEYYLDKGGAAVQSLDGITIPRKTLVNNLKLSRDQKNVSIKTLQAIKKNRAESSGIMRAAPIDDVIAYAKQVLGGTWSGIEWANKWQSYEGGFATGSDSYASYYDNNCGPIAITNIIRLYGKKNGITAITSKSNSAIFSKVIEARQIPNTENYYYTPNTGTVFSTANSYIKACFSKFTTNSIIVNGQFLASVTNIKNVSKSGDLMLLDVKKSHVIYGGTMNHGVVGYAYNVIERASDGYQLTFLKIADGWNSSGRYLHSDGISTYNFWRIYT